MFALILGSITVVGITVVGFHLWSSWRRNKNVTTASQETVTSSPSPGHTTAGYGGISSQPHRLIDRFDFNIGQSYYVNNDENREIKLIPTISKGEIFKRARQYYPELLDIRSEGHITVTLPVSLFKWDEVKLIGFTDPKAFWPLTGTKRSEIGQRIEEEVLFRRTFLTRPSDPAIDEIVGDDSFAGFTDEFFYRSDPDSDPLSAHEGDFSSSPLSHRLHLWTFLIWPELYLDLINDQLRTIFRTCGFYVPTELTYTAEVMYENNAGPVFRSLTYTEPAAAVTPPPKPTAPLRLKRRVQSSYKRYVVQPKDNPI